MKNDQAFWKATMTIVVQAPTKAIAELAILKAWEEINKIAGSCAAEIPEVREYGTNPITGRDQKTGEPR